MNRAHITLMEFYKLVWSLYILGALEVELEAIALLAGGKIAPKHSRKRV